MNSSPCEPTRYRLICFASFLYRTRELRVRTNGNMVARLTLKAVCCAGLVFLGCKQRFFAYCYIQQFLPRKVWKSSRLFSEWVWAPYIRSERYPDQFSASRESQLRDFQTTTGSSSFFNFLARKKNLIGQSSRFVQLPVFWPPNWKMS